MIKNPQRYKKLNIVVISDTHKNHASMSIPDGDILLHCGDFTNKGDWRNLSSGQIPQSIIDFNQWLGKLPHQHKIVICGNHETGFGQLFKDDIQTKLLANCIYLKEELIEIEGIVIYGCPWPHNLSDEYEWSSIPSNIDILMTHIPPKFILDVAFQPKKPPATEPCTMCDSKVHGHYGHWGSKSLIKEIRQRIHPRVHCFGHVHDDAGYKYDNQTLFINAAADLTNQCFMFYFYVDLEKH